MSNYYTSGKSSVLGEYHRPMCGLITKSVICFIVTCMLNLCKREETMHVLNIYFIFISHLAYFS